MNWAWASTLDQIWRSPAFPMWLTLAAAGFFGVIGIVTLFRAEKSVANGALTIITLLAIGIAAAATTRGFGLGNVASVNDNNSASPGTAAIPALSCIDDLAGEVVLAACEKVLFGSSESTAAALSYAARQITRLSEFGEFSASNNEMTPQLEALRHTVEHDRYGLMAQVLVARDHCTPSDCAAFSSLSDRRRIVANMEERTYDGLVARYSANWNNPAPLAVAPATALIPVAPTGRPTNAEFPSAASTPPVSIMTAEPAIAPAQPRPSAPAASAPTPSPRPTPPPAVAAAKKQPAPKPVRTTAPVSIAPATPSPAASAPEASAPAASRD
jgi:hypothetical protein